MSNNSNEHSIYAASAAHRWIACPGSVSLSEGIDTGTNEHAEEGTRAHALAEHLLRENIHPSRDEKTHVHLVEEYGAEMVDAVEMYCEAVWEELGEGEVAGKVLHVEEKFTLAEYGLPNCWGTNDACVEQFFGKLTIFDLKYGKGVPVEVEENPQLMYYALGALLLGEFEEVELVVVQPRRHHANGPIRRWNVPAERLEGFLVEIRLAIEAAEEEFPKFVAGEKQCRWCPAKVTCPENRRFIEETLQTEITTLDAPKFPVVESLTKEDMMRVLQHKSAIESWMKAVAKHVHEKMMLGEEYEGFKLVQGYGNRKWKGDKEETKKELRKLGLKVAEIEKKEILSPAQIEKLLPKHDKGKIAKLVEKPRTAPKVVPLDDAGTKLEPWKELEFPNAENENAKQ